ncbi:hypothetical protein DFJ58DRAFT_728348 [Suillus subalutaceus]|uniref:uncharacterized protein n=1 Tax=Suillus subalutaceus TaxID=48586 RepID=UPI001B882415|nr:uncharacterized protein DFJ58DRAFT_728348 [Suillus subalutaceus]KAG1852847.1 hypothetical protein DFJ58DRAFT_728348 [Suillus subalutaceus]
MKLSLVFSTLASLVVLATAYPTQGATGVAKRSNVEKREDLNFQYYERGEEKREDLDSEALKYRDIYKRGEEKREDPDSEPLKYLDIYKRGREALGS